MKTPSVVDFILTTPIEMSVGGVMSEVQSLELVAPSKKMLRKTFKLQQLMTKALLDSQGAFKEIQGTSTTDEAKEDTTFNAGTVKIILLASTIDICFVLDEVQTIALAGGVKVGEVNLNQIQLDKMDEDDFIALAMEYIANFIVPLVLESLSMS